MSENKYSVTMIRTNLKKNSGIDSFKAVAIFAIVCIHTHPFIGYDWEQPVVANLRPIGIMVDNISRFAIPFFFAASGYFFGIHIENRTSSEISRICILYAKILAVLFLTWSFIYMLPNVTDLFLNTAKDGFIYGFVRTIYRSIKYKAMFFAHPLQFINGTAYHLWFLPTLIACIGLLTVIIKSDKTRLMPCLMLISAAFMLAQKYCGIFLPKVLFCYNTVMPASIPFGFFFTAAGWWLTGHRVAISKKTIFLIIAIGFAMHMVEVILLWRYCAYEPFNRHVVSLGVIPYSIWIFLLAVSSPTFGRGTLLPFIATMSLGIYLIHYYLRDNLWVLGRIIDPIIWQILFPFLVIGISIAIVSILKSFRSTKWLVVF